MRNTLKAGLAYFIIVFAIGFVLGTMRVLVLVPRMGNLYAVMVELPVMLSASWFICRALIKHWQVLPGLSHRAVMGIFAFILLMTAEFFLSVALFGRTSAAYISDLITPAGGIGFAGQVVFGLWPLVQWHVSKRSG